MIHLVIMSCVWYELKKPKHLDSNSLRRPQVGRKEPCAWKDRWLIVETHNKVWVSSPGFVNSNEGNVASARSTATGRPDGTGNLSRTYCYPLLSRSRRELVREDSVKLFDPALVSLKYT
jgi:hypothetical protein